MSTNYSYRNGEKMPLFKKNDEFIVRARPEALQGVKAVMIEQVSPSSYRMKVAAEELDAAMTQCRAIALTHHAYYCEYDRQSFDITDRILVRFKEAPSDAQLNDFCSKYALLTLKQYSDSEYLFQLTNDTGMNPVKLVVMITENEPMIAYSEHDLNMKVKKYAVATPNDPEYRAQWHLHTHTAPGPNFDPRSSTHCEDAWRLLDGFGSPAVVLAVSDDGCKLTHADFNSPGKFAAWGYFEGSNLITDSDINADPSKMYEAGNDHGTSCAGVMAGEVDGVLTVGAAPACRLLPIKWETVGNGGLAISDSKLLTALNFIRNKADVFSNSWGSSPSMRFSNTVLDTIRQLSAGEGRRGKGICFLWAAGNENCPIEHSSSVDVPFTNGWGVRAGARQWVGVETSRIFVHNLASIPGLLHCAALASNAQRSHYSNHGTGVLITAPSSNVHEYQRIRVPGFGITTATGENVSVTDSFGGTSSATPLIAGIAGLVISANPGLTAAEVVSILLQTCSKDLNFAPYPRTPAALFDQNTSWDVSPVSPFNDGAFRDIGSPNGTWSPWFGHGNVDAAKAVEKALSLTQPLQNPVIQSALVRPRGADPETVTFKNAAAQDFSVEGWTIRNQRNEVQKLRGAIPARGTLKITLERGRIALLNTGGALALIDPAGKEIHRVSYTRRDVRLGVETVFI